MIRCCLCVCVLLWFAVFVSIFYIVSRESLLRRGYIFDSGRIYGQWLVALFFFLFVLFYSTLNTECIAWNGI